MILIPCRDTCRSKVQRMTSASQLELQRELGGNVGQHAAVGSILIAVSIVFSFSAFALFVLQIAFAPTAEKDVEALEDKNGDAKTEPTDSDILQTGMPLLGTRHRRFAQRGNR